MTPKTDQSDPLSGGLWSRLSVQDRIALVALGLQISVSLVLTLIVGLVDDAKISVGGKLALLAGNVALLVVVLQFALTKLFDEQRSHLDKLGLSLRGMENRLADAVEEMERITTLGEAYVKISRQGDREKQQYLSTLDNFLRRLSNWIDDKRSGSLDTMDYYRVLRELAVALEQDRTSSVASAAVYKGEIWALSFVLDDEWDSSSLQERTWFQQLERLDSSGVPTRRLWAIDKKMRAALEREPIQEDGIELIRRFSLYCAKKTKFPNTKSFVIPKEEISDEHFRLFGKGFFAGRFTDSSLRLIRGVCFDNLLASNSLGGEIDFDANRIRQIRMHWEEYLAIGESLNDYVLRIASPSAKENMRQFSWDIERE